MEDELEIDNGINLDNLYEGQQSQLILIVAKSGRGKSTSMINLNPETTFLINIMGKALPFPKGMKYRTGKNMLISTSTPVICAKLQEISNKQPEIKTVVIDDAQYLMATEFMATAMVKGYEKFTKMARNFWDVLFLSTKLRGDLKVFMLAHEEETFTGERKMKTLGKMLDDKITPEGMSSMVLYGEIRVKDNRNKYMFVTQSDGSTNAKTPMGMFPIEIDNDLELVCKRTDEYYNGVELKDSKLAFLTQTLA